MKLYTFYTPNCLKVEIALSELELDCEREKVALAKGEHMTEAFKRVNPHQKIPVLEVGDVALPESNAILEYLGRTNAGPLWPQDPIQEAQLAAWLHFESTHLAPPCAAIWWSDTLSPKRGVEASSDARLELAASDLERPLGVLELHLADRDHLAGGAFTLADCALGTTLSMLKGTRLDLAQNWPKADAYAARLRDRPSWSVADGDRRLHWSD